MDDEIGILGSGYVIQGVCYDIEFANVEKSVLT